MTPHHTPQTARPQKHKGRKPAEERRVGELEEGDGEGGEEGRARVGEGELVEVVDVGDAEVEGGGEEGGEDGGGGERGGVGGGGSGRGRGRGEGEEGEGEEEGAEEEFFC